MSKVFLLFGLVIVLVLSACSAAGAQPPAPVAPAAATIALETNPNPPVAGDLELRFTVTDTQGQPVSGADFDVIADHVDHSGMIMHGKATDQGNGVYSITANFSMSGNWKLSVQVKKDSLDHKQDIALKIN